MSELDNLAGGIVAVAVGGAAAAGIEPILEPARQQAWIESQAKVLDVGALAELVAQRFLTQTDAATEAQRNGYNANKVAALIQLALIAPTVGETLDLWRRGKFGTPDPKNPPEEVTHALDKAQLEAKYHPALLEFYNGRLDPALLATMVQRSVIPNSVKPGTSEALLPVSEADAAASVYAEWNTSTEAQLGESAATGHNVTPMPQVGLDTLAEAAAHGIDFDRLAAEARIVGLPASPDLAARMVFRGIATPADFVQALAEGNARIEWAPALFQAFREILTASNYAELELRGFLTRKERLAKTLQHGMSEADSDALYNMMGRSIPVHQVTTGLARGGKFGVQDEVIPPEYLQTLQRGNLRPEYYNLAYHNRFTIPSAFVIRALLQGGAIDTATGEQLFLASGWNPTLAKQVAEFYGTTTTAATDPHITKAQTQLWTATHRAYLTGELSDVDAKKALTKVGVPTGVQDDILGFWAAEHDVTRKPLTAAQVKKAYKKATVNPATNAPWTRDEAIAALVERGYRLEDAETYIDTP